MPKRQIKPVGLRTARVIVFGYLFVFFYSQGYSYIKFNTNKIIQMSYLSTQDDATYNK